MDAVITVNGLCKRYGSTCAVDGISFEVARGEIFGLLGRNGAGKTTTVECLQGLRHADDGEIRVLELDPRADGQRLRERIGCQLQESALPSAIRVLEALQWFASFSSVGADWERLLEQWGLDDKRDAHFSDLSGGQRQRLFVALALVNDPDVVFLDEMTTGLDPAGRRVAWDLIEAIRERGTTVVLVTHFMDEAERLCDRLAVMDAGRIVALDTPQRLVASHTRDVSVRFSTPTVDLEWLRAVGGVREVGRRDGSVRVRTQSDAVVDVAAALAEHGVRPDDLAVERPSLEDVFLQITGRRLEE